MIDIYNISLLDLLPENLKQDEDLKAIAEAITPEMQSISLEIKDIIELANLENLLEAVIDLLAWENHVDFYDTSLPLEQKIKLVENADFYHRSKGTPAAVEDLIVTLFGEGKVVEWFEYDAEPGYFKVVTNNRAVTEERAQEFVAALNSVKRKSAWLEKIEITQVENMDLYIGGFVHTGDKMELRQVV
ncbi:phage tail protein I [Schinkia sp. CFF1]